LKLLMFFDVLPPHLRSGSIDKHVRMLSKELRKKGHEIVVCAVGYQPQYEDEKGIKSYGLEGLFQRIPFLYKDMLFKWHPPTADWLITKALRRIIEQERIQLMHTHGRALYSALPLKRQLKIPLVASLHGYEFICPKADLLKEDHALCDKPLTNKCISCGIACYGPAKSVAAYVATKVNKKSLKNVDKFIAVSACTKATYLPHLGVEESKIVVIPNFYLPDTYETVKISGRLPRDFILFVGGLLPTKGLDVLMAAYHKIGTATKLLIIGYSHPDHHYQSTDNVVLIKNAPYDLLREAYQNCRFIILPSIRPEPFPVVTLEAMSQKKAVIASRIGGLAETVVDKETGLLVPPGDVEALSQAIEYLLANSNVADRMGQKGYERWQQCFTPEVAAPKFEELYKSIL